MSLVSSKNVSLAVTTLRASRSRSFFTMLGVIIAVASITTIVSIGDGIKHDVAQQANTYSKDVITIRPATIGGAHRSLSSLAGNTVSGVLSTKDATTIAKVPHVEDSVPLSIVGSGAQGDASFNAVVFAVNSDLPQVLQQQLLFGGFFTPSDDDNNVAVLGSSAAQHLFDQDVPLGRSFTIRGQQFIVDGVLSSFATTPLTSDINFNDAIFVPSSAAKSLAPNGAPVYEILAKIDSDSHITGADKAITKALTKTHHGQSDFTVLTPEELATETTATLKLVTNLIVAAAAITLLVSGIGIMNVMLVSVTERIHEIGIRKAVGATNLQILGQFITEAVVLSVVGSILGAIVAFLAGIILHLTTSLTPQYNWAAAGLACAAACVLGLIFGTVPAYKAARKDPILALRNE